MSRKVTRREVEVLEDLRRTSGWYLAAWRDYRGLTQKDVADEAGMKSSAISELENGKPRKDGATPRFNRTIIENVARALSVTEGMLFDVNPFTANPMWIRFRDATAGLNADGQAMAEKFVEILESERRKAV
jgi:transcriptional regulator with XRE-family HTH domain